MIKLLKQRNIFLLLLCLGVIGFMSCSDDETGGGEEPPEKEWVEIEEKATPNPMNAYTPLKLKGERNPEKMLGYGYDVTGKVSDYSAVKGHILDLDWIGEDASNSVRAFVLRGTYGFVVQGVDRKDYLLNLNTGRFGRLNDDEKISYHTGTLLDSEILNDPENKYSYRSEHYVYEHIVYKYIALPYILKKYMTEGFKQDLNQLSSKEMIKKYGTHLINELKTGCRLDMLYRSEIRGVKYQQEGTDKIKTENFPVEDKLKIIKGGASDAASKIGLSFMHWSSDPEREKYIKRNINPIAHIEAYGGDESLLPSGTYNLEKGFPHLDQTKWLGSANEETYTLILIDAAVPLYELVEDRDKQIELKLAIDNYILSRQVN